MKIVGFDTMVELFEYACKKDRAAVQYCIDILKLSHFWDDVVDRDEVSEEEANDVMTAAVIGLNTNPFFLKNMSVLLGLSSIIISNWLTANAYEREKENLNKAYMLRAQLYNLPVLCAFIIGGQPWANQVAKTAWGTYGEDFNKYCEEIKNA